MVKLRMPCVRHMYDVYVAGFHSALRSSAVNDSGVVRGTGYQIPGRLHIGTVNLHDFIGPRKVDELKRQQICKVNVWWGVCPDLEYTLF